MGKPTYYEQLRDPRWQERRLRIMERDNFTCIDCGGKENTLNVHHSYYRKGVMVWEYEDCELSTLCEGCHQKRHEKLDYLLLLFGLMTQNMILRVLGYTDATALASSIIDNLVAYNEDQIFGIMDRKGTPHEAFQEFTDGNGNPSLGKIDWDCLCAIHETYRHKGCKSEGPPLVVRCAFCDPEE